MAEGHVTGTGDRVKVSAVLHGTKSTHLRPKKQYSCGSRGECLQSALLQYSRSSSELVTHACHEQQLSVIGRGCHVEH
jgi:hypothetical protein